MMLFTFLVRVLHGALKACSNLDAGRKKKDLRSDMLALELIGIPKNIQLLEIHRRDFLGRRLDLVVRN